MPEKSTGRCACGGVAYEVNGPLRQIVACHCEQCRRTSGHYVAATATRRQYFRLITRGNLKWFEAIAGYRRGFCGDCGASLFFEEVGGDRVSIAAGSLDSGEGLFIAAQLYTAEKGRYYNIDENIPGSPRGDHQVPLP